MGEISLALENVWGRYRASAQSNSGIYSEMYNSEAEFMDVTAEVNEFLSKNGRRPRILVCKLGQDGHDRGAKIISSAFADFGFDVDIAPMFQIPEEVVKPSVRK